MGADYDKDYSDTESAQFQAPSPPPTNPKDHTDDALAAQLAEAKAQGLETEEPVKKKKKRRSKNKNVRHRIWKLKALRVGRRYF